MARKLRMRLDPQHDVQVARRTAAKARLAFSADPDLRPRVDPGRDLHSQPLGLLNATLAATLRTRALENAAPAAACGADRRGDDLAEERLRRPPDLA